MLLSRNTTYVAPVAKYSYENNIFLSDFALLVNLVALNSVTSKKHVNIVLSLTRISKNKLSLVEVMYVNGTIITISDISTNQIIHAIRY